jgi:hypothetical protein
MSKALAPADASASLDEHAKTILDANEKLRSDFCNYITTVGGSLKAAQESLASDHGGFYKWSREQFGWSKSRVYQLLAASDVVSRLSTTVDDRISLPSNEAQCRALASLPKKRLGKVWTQAVEVASERGCEPTAALIRRLAPASSRAASNVSPPSDSDRALRRIDTAVREVVLHHPERIADAVAMLSSLIEFCERPHVLPARADGTPKVSLDISPTLLADRTPLVLDHSPAGPASPASHDLQSPALIGGAA